MEVDSDDPDDPPRTTSESLVDVLESTVIDLTDMLCPTEEVLDSNERSYVLMTAAHNEELFIEKTITSVLSQSVPPRKWIIISDCSSDRTDEIVQEYARQSKIIRFLRITRPPGRSFGAKVMALRRASELLNGVEFDFIGNVDADVSLEPVYFARLIDQFERNLRLGLAAGFIWEKKAGQFRSRAANRVDSVPHGAQLVRRQCYQEIGGYAVLKHGGEDWYAQTCAKMNGWQAQAIPELTIFHHRSTGRGTSLLRSKFRLGRLDYSFGSDPLFELLKCTQRLPETPLFLGGVARWLGFSWSYVCRDRRPVSDDFVAFLRTEQKAKVASLFRNFELPGMDRARPQ